MTGPVEETEVVLALPLLPELPKPLQAASTVNAKHVIASRACRRRTTPLDRALGVRG